ncbi:MAG: hypothetical protein AAF560_05130 [Acidobacteriota bacterium]
MLFRNATKIALGTLILLTLTGCKFGVNRSLRVADGETVEGGMQTVNGSVRIGRDAKVGGASRSVNGGITVGDSSTVGSLSTVNGSIHIAESVRVNGDLGTINGAVESGRGTEVDGDISTINGRLELDETEVRGSLSTHNGAVTLRGGRVHRDIVIEGRGGNKSSSELKIRLLDGAVVEGNVIVEDEARRVTVYLEDGGEVQGEIRGAEVAS